MQTPLAIAVLALLREHPMHPYEMQQLLRDRHLDELIKVHAGSLYHTVDRLGRDGMIEPAGTERAGNRPERTAYRLTEAGNDVVESWVAERLAHPVREFPVYPYALTEAHNLTADRAAGALTQRCEALEADLARVIASQAQPSNGEVYRIGREYRAAMLRAELTWTRDLIDRIQRKDFPWDPWN